MEAPAQQQQLHVDDTVQQLLDQAQAAIQASNASQALQVLTKVLCLFPDGDMRNPVRKCLCMHLHLCMPALDTTSMHQQRPST